MKLVNFYADDGVRAGLLHADGVEDLATSAQWIGPAPVSLADIADLAQRLHPSSEIRKPVDSLRLAPIVLAPEKIICIGLNYRRHAAESRMEIPSVPTIFAKFRNSLNGHGGEILLRPADHKYDYEAELGVIIGREASEVSQADALDYVAGYCCANDFSARGVQLATSQWGAGKMFDGSLPLGPLLATKEEVPDPQTLGIRCFVNGEQRQSSSTADMIFGVAQIVSFLSRLLTLKAGDVIATGTPEGVLAGKAEPRWLKAGDEITVEIDGLGRLSNRLVAPPIPFHVRTLSVCKASTTY